MMLLVLIYLSIIRWIFGLPAQIHLPSIRKPPSEVSPDYLIPNIRLPDLPSDTVLNTTLSGEFYVKVPENVTYDDNARWRVVGGENAKEGQFPYIVSLRRTTGAHFCGGTIVSNVYIISASHCTSGFAVSGIIVVAGTTTLNSGGTAYSVARIVNHPDYNSETDENDISLIRTSVIMPFGDLVSSLPIAAGDVGAGYQAVLSGWGSTYLNGALPNNLQFLNLMIIDNSECASSHYPFDVFDSNICTFTQNGEGACHGDSGGPLVVQNILVGVVSWGTPCAVGDPDVFTRISSFAEWIQTSAT